ncbi:N-hydroxyarylamine O-acetyltransferase [Marininema mesophilum]|uniref:N-hydroxyarylamine O-acetyltransferase n=1 Tax=Marininema mesophilum TaxID=1048340 RepID=A0A1H3BCL2_9BACL|nr:arylamine N-acetyltransferase [Marininema mesophilum]SDX39677.1 N-hydroxyarylamine O-acetyltransferase [Marininema mesophilum]
MDAKTYLARIGAPRVTSSDLPTLTKLIQHHLYTVPFENIDIHEGKPIHLHPDEIAQKIINHRRGGFCYELNSAFANLLKELGYQVSLLSGRVRTSTDHMALLVRLDQDYLVDVGFGDSFRYPLPISGAKRKDVSGWYRIRLRTHPNIYALEKRKGRRWLPEYLFTTQERRLEEFEGMCIHQQTSPTSIFRQKFLCTIATPGGRLTVSDHHFTITERGKVQKIPINSIEKRRDIIQYWFRMNY